MNRGFIVLFFSAALLGACTTPNTMYKNPKTGQIEACGGNVSSSLAGGAIGYHIQKANDDKCREALEKNGFVILEDEREVLQEEENLSDDVND